MKYIRGCFAVFASAVMLAPAFGAGWLGDGSSRSRRVIRLRNPAARVEHWVENTATGRTANYTIQFIDGRTQEVRGVSYDLLLRYARFDPLVNPPNVPPHLQSGAGVGGDERRTHIVQFVTQPLPQYRRGVEDAGGVIYNYLANHAYLVRMDEEAKDAIARLPYVRSISDYHAAYKLDESLLEVLRDVNATLPPQRYNIQVVERGLAHKDIVAARVIELGGRVDAMIPSGFILEATLDGVQLLEVARLHEVLFIDPWGPPEPDMNNAREIGGANFIETVEGLRGEGVRAEVMDGNLYTGHGDFAARPPLIHGAVSGDNWHGTATYGINFGTGAGNALGRGMVPMAQGIFASYATLTDRYTHTAQLLQSPYFAVYQSNSWGNQRTRAYTTISHQMDDILFINDILICQSQSNAGNQDSRPEAWAKNIVSVGGVQHVNTLSRTDDFWGGGASIGPAADGRIKPDVTHFYENIFTTDRDSPTDYMTGFGGTSGATPIVAGHFGILFQMWHEALFGNDVEGGGTVFSNRPHMSTAKALMINGARPYDWTLGGPNADLTRVRQGWGMPDLQTLYNNRQRTFLVNEDRVLENLERATYQLTVSSGIPEFRATLVYTDPAGTTSSTQHRINDLTLKVTAPNATVYWGNGGLSAGIWSSAGGSADTKNTVESVFLQNPAAGVWTVEVIASEVVADSHLESTDIDADFALVVSGVVVPGNEATIADATVTEGTLLSGGVSEISDSDDVRLRARSEIGFTAQEPHLLELTVGLISPNATPATLDIQAEGRLNHPGGVTRVRLRNWSTNGFEQVGQYPVGTTEVVRTLTGINATNRVRASDGRIELALRQSVVATFTAMGFDSFFDHVQVTVE